MKRDEKGIKEEKFIENVNLIEEKFVNTWKIQRNFIYQQKIILLELYVIVLIF